MIGNHVLKSANSGIHLYLRGITTEEVFKRYGTRAEAFGRLDG